MSLRTNAIAELTLFWLQSRHGCLVAEAVPVAVSHGLSDIDVIALRPDLKQIVLPDGGLIGPRIIVETKDEHDFERTGLEFGKSLRKDVAAMGYGTCVPPGTTGIKFTMLRQEHFDKARELFGTEDFDRLLVVHAVSEQAIADLCNDLSERRIHVIGIREVVRDLHAWYAIHPRKSGLRNSLVGDLFHLLVGFCGFGDEQLRSSYSAAASSDPAS